MIRKPHLHNGQFTTLHHIVKKFYLEKVPNFVCILLPTKRNIFLTCFEPVGFEVCGFLLDQKNRTTRGPRSCCSNYWTWHEGGYYVAWFGIMINIFDYDIVIKSHILCSLYIKVSQSKNSKVEKILKGSLDSIPSPSRGHKHLKFLFIFFLTKHCWELSTNFLYKSVCWQRPAMICLYTSSQLFHT